MRDTNDNSPLSRYRHIFEQVTTPIGVLNSQLQIVAANISFINLFESQSQDILGMSFKDLLQNERIPDNITQFKELLKDNSKSFNIFNTYQTNRKNSFSAFTQVHVISSEKSKISEFFVSLFKVKKIEDTKASHQAIEDKQNRELLTNIIFVSQRNIALKAIIKSLNNLSQKIEDSAIKDELKDIKLNITKMVKLDESWEKFNLHFEKVHPGFYQKLREKGPTLTQKELKQCAYIRLGLSYKETAQLLNITTKGIEMARYRIKKKLKLDQDLRLSDYINSI